MNSRYPTLQCVYSRVNQRSATPLDCSRRSTVEFPSPLASAAAPQLFPPSSLFGYIDSPATNIGNDMHQNLGVLHGPWFLLGKYHCIYEKKVKLKLFGAQEKLQETLCSCWNQRLQVWKWKHPGPSALWIALLKGAEFAIQINLPCYEHHTYKSPTEPSGTHHCRVLNGSGRPDKPDRTEPENVCFLFFSEMPNTAVLETATWSLLQNLDSPNGLYVFGLSFHWPAVRTPSLSALSN